MVPCAACRGDLWSQRLPRFCDVHGEDLGLRLRPRSGEWRLRYDLVIRLPQERQDRSREIDRLGSELKAVARATLVGAKASRVG